MMPVHRMSTFKKDYKLCKNRGYVMDKLKKVITLLSIPSALPSIYKDHSLLGNYKGYRECHIQPDWLLVYRYKDNCLELYRTGTHADIF